MKWRAHAIALGLWAIPPIISGLIMESNASHNWIDLGHGFTVVWVVGTWLVVAIPTTIVVALGRTGREGLVILVHVVALFLAAIAFWFMQG